MIRDRRGTIVYGQGFDRSKASLVPPDRALRLPLPARALDYITQQAGRHFDPAVVEASFALTPPAAG